MNVIFSCSTSSALNVLGLHIYEFKNNQNLRASVNAANTTTQPKSRIQILDISTFSEIYVFDKTFKE